MKRVSDYTNNEILNIIELYQSGMSFTSISINLNIDKRVIKKILINNDVWFENRDDLKIEFSDNEIKKIINLYVIEKQNATDIGKIFNISKRPIIRILKNNNVLRKGKSNGVKITLSKEQEDKIKDLYLNEYLSPNKISKICNISSSYIYKFLVKSGYIRSRSEATKISVTGRKVSQKGIENMKIGQRKLVLSGKRKQTGGVCKTYVIQNLKCQGTYEKKYIEILLKNNIKLPINGKYILTPYGGYYPDFIYDDKFIEIKSTYTYDILLGKVKNHWKNQIDNKQYKKIKWVNDNIMPVQIIVLNKNNINEIINI